MYVFQAFPKWKYHDSGESVIVEHEDAETALGDGWHDLPIEPQEVSRREVLLAAAAEKGIKIDKRWSDDKIQAAIDGATV